MAYIESHQELGRHPKTKRLARALGVSLPAAVGHLQFLWWWALDYAKDGDLSRYDDDDIADAMLWDGDPGKLRMALVDAGFLDESDGRLLIHDWDEYGGKLLAKRQADARRKAAQRTSAGKAQDKAQDDDRMSAGHPADIQRTAQVDKIRIDKKREKISPQEEERSSERGADAPATPSASRISAPTKRPLTEKALDDLQNEFPDIDVRAAAQDYLNWSGSSKHIDKVLGLRNQLKSEAVRRKFPRKVASKTPADDPFGNMLVFAAPPPRQGGSA